MINMSLPDMSPNVVVPYFEHTREPFIESNGILLLIVEVIDYSLRYHNLHNWTPTWNLDFLRMNNTAVYFNEEFAETVISPNVEVQAIRLANRFGFNITSWLELSNGEEAICYQVYYLLALYHHNKPFQFQMFSFACYASRMALRRNRNSLVNDVAWALLLALRHILSYVEHYRGVYFVRDIYVNHLVDNQPLDVDEGIEDAADADSTPRRNDEDSVSTGPILLLVKEAIDCYLRDFHSHGLILTEPLLVLRRVEMRYFDENLRKAITHYRAEEKAIQIACERGFNEETWLKIYIPLVAINFQFYFLRQVFAHGSMLLMLCFACYSCKIARQRNRDSLVNAVVKALDNFLHEYFPSRSYYSNLQNEAMCYNRVHKDRHSHSDDEGVRDVANEVVGSEERNEAASSEEGTSSQSDNEENKAQERSNAQRYEEREEEKEDVASDVSEGNGFDAPTEMSEIFTLEEESGSITSEKGNDILTSEEEDRSNIFEEDS